MAMTDRVRRLRQASMDTIHSLSSERAEIMTEFYSKENGFLSTPVKRALSFRYLLEHKTLYVEQGELIVGEKGPYPKAAPTFPELCCHSLEDLDILNNREKISFSVSPAVRSVYSEKIIPFWKERSMRKLLFDEMTPEWKDAYEAGIFTEFMEQRAPGHTVLDDKIYRKGMLDFIADIDQSLTALDYLNDPEAYSKGEELKAMRIAAQAIIAFAARYAALAREKAETADPERREELRKIAEICEWVPANAPRTFWEALQYYWFIHLGVTQELNTWDAFCPGRLDQHLYPFYQRGIKDGSLTRDQAVELLQCFWIKFNNQPAPPKVGVTAAESGTYTDFAQINTGGLKEEGSDGVNEVTYILLDVIEEMRLLQPSASIQVSKKNPDEFIKRAARIIRTGFGQPSVFNADLIVQELVRMGKSVTDARNGGSSGCVEVGAFGKEAYILTGYLNTVKILEITLNDGVDPRTGKQIGLQTGDPRSFKNFEDFFAAFERQLRHFIEIKIRGNQVIERLYAAYMPAPFLSLLIDDCIRKGKDYHNGGARYDSSYIQVVGLGTLTDAVTSIKFHIFDKKDLQMGELLDALETNFVSLERLRQLLLNRTPRYGNDDDYADHLMVRLSDVFMNLIDGRPNTRGGSYRVNFLPTTCHIYFGSVTGATPDGRIAWQPVSEGVSPVQGADHCGPTAVIKSVAKMDQVRTGGTLLNQKFIPQLLKDDEGLVRLVQLIRSYFTLDGHHIQFNVVDAQVLREAQLHPEQYRSLIVRVAGYSDYFCDLSKALQDEIIARTEHKAFS